MDYFGRDRLQFINKKKGLALTAFIAVAVVSLVYIERDSMSAYSVQAKKTSESISPSNSTIPTVINALDKNSVPIVDYGYVNGIYVGPARNPITIAHKALGYYDSIKAHSNDVKSKKLMINNVNWLVNNAVVHGNYSILEYKFPWPPYGLKPPWQSGMAQGESIKALVRAYKATHDQKYLDNARLLINSFFVEVKDGGVTYKTPKDGWWYEEYASRNEPRESRVLNGMIYTLLAIYEYLGNTHDSNAKYLFDQGVTALKKDISRYNYHDTYTYYDILGNISPLQYHKAVLQTLAPLYDITKEPIFKTYLDKWENFRKSPEVIPK